MKATVSTLGGVCAICFPDRTELVRLDDMSLVPPEISHLAFGSACDWEEIEADGRDNILAGALRRFRSARAASNVELCLTGLDEGLQEELLEEVDEILSIIGSSDPIASALLRAPLKDPSPLVALSGSCLSKGLANVGGLLDLIYDLQPLLRRLSDRWAAIPDDHFLPNYHNRQKIWLDATANCVVLNTLRAPSYSEVERCWAQLASMSTQPQARRTIARIAKAIATSLFPEQNPANFDVRSILDTTSDDRFERTDRRQPKEPWTVAFNRIMRQIDAISLAVAEGRDARARKYLSELLV